MIEIAGTPNALVQRRAEVAEPSRGGIITDLQRTCLAILRAEWSTLAIVRMSRGAPGDLVASTLAEMARLYRLRPVRALSGSDTSAAQVALLVDELASERDAGSRAVITIDEPRTNPAGAPLLAAVDAAVFLVRLGASEFRSLEEAVALVGRERIIGCAIVP